MISAIGSNPILLLKHTAGPPAGMVEGQSLEDALFWAEKHAADYTMSEHNWRWFADEVVRIRAAIAQATQQEKQA